MNILYQSLLIFSIDFVIVLMSFIIWYFMWVREYGCSIPDEYYGTYHTYFNSKNFQMVFSNLFKKILNFDKDYILASCGHEAYAYLLFQRRTLTLVFILTFFSISFSIVTTFLTFNEDFNFNLFIEKMLFENRVLTNYTSTIHLICLFLFFLLMIRYLYMLKSDLKNVYFARYDNLSKTKNHEWLRCRTLHISGISPLNRNINMLKTKLNYYLSSKLNNESSVVEVSFIPDYQILTELEIKKEEINDIKKLIPNSRSKLYRYCCLDKTFYSEESIKNELEDIDAKLDQECQKPVLSSGHAFITFSSLKAAYTCLEHFRDDTLSNFKIKIMEMQDKRDVNVNRKGSTFQAFHDEDLMNDYDDLENFDIVLDQMIEPMDIIWTNLGGDRGINVYRKLFCNIMIIVVIFFISTPTVMYTSIKSAILPDEIENNKNSFINQLNSLVSPIIILILNQLLILLIDVIGRFEKNYTHSRMQFSIFKNTFIYFIFNMLLIPGISMTTATSIYGITFKGQSFTFEYLSSTISNIYRVSNSFFYVNIILQMATFSFIFYLLRIDELVINSFSTFIVYYKRHFVNNGKQWHRKEIDVFQYGYFYAQMITILSITFVFASTVPFVSFVALFYFVLRHISDYFSLLMVHREEIDSNGEMVSLL
jgi:hypothetical protein